MSTLKGNVFPNYRSGPSKDALQPLSPRRLTPTTYGRKLAGVCRHRNRRSRTEATQRSDSRWGGGGEEDLAQMFSHDVTWTKSTI